MSKAEQSGVRMPTHDEIEQRLGTWETFAGATPTATQLQQAAARILNGEDTTTEQVAMQTLRYIWRRQDLRHGEAWKAAEGDCERVLDAVRAGEVTR